MTEEEYHGVRGTLLDSIHEKRSAMVGQEVGKEQKTQRPGENPGYIGKYEMFRIFENIRNMAGAR